MDLKRLEALATTLQSKVQAATKPARPANKSWYEIRNMGDETIIGIYDEIGEWGVTARDFLSELNAIKTPNITVQIGSPGGAVWDALAIYAGLSSHPATVTTDVVSHAFSAASFIAQAGQYRKIRRNARMMIHDPAIGGGVVFGNARQLRAFKDEIEEIAVQLDEAADNIASIYAERSGNDSIQHWRDLMEAETFFSADSALAEGLVDEVVAADGTSKTSETDNEPQNSNPPAPVEASIEDFGGLMSALKGVFQ